MRTSGVGLGGSPPPSAAGPRRGRAASGDETVPTPPTASQKEDVTNNRLWIGDGAGGPWGWDWIWGPRDVSQGGCQGWGEGGEAWNIPEAGSRLERKMHSVPAHRSGLFGYF